MLTLVLAWTYKKKPSHFFYSSHFWVFYDMKIKLVIICQFFFFRNVLRKMTYFILVLHQHKRKWIWKPKCIHSLLCFVDWQGQSPLDVAMAAQNMELVRRLRITRYEQGLDIRHPLQSFTTNKVIVKLSMCHSSLCPRDVSLCNISLLTTTPMRLCLK